MKIYLFIVMLCVSTCGFAQPQIIKQAIISTTTTVIAPEGEDVQNLQSSGSGGGAQMFRNFGDGETKSTTYLKDDMIKTVMKSDMGRSTIIRNNSSTLTTTLIEMMGNKMGFFITDEEQAEMKLKMDSMMKQRRSADSSRAPMPNAAASNVEISYADGIKKIAGYNCKKAYVISTRLLGLKDSVTVWYNPEIKFEYASSTGGTSSFGGFGSVGNFTTLNGTDKIDGFVMQYEMKMRRGRIMTVEVTKIDIKKEIMEKEFEIPKDFDVKPMKEFQSMMQGGPGGGMQFRMERN